MAEAKGLNSDALKNRWRDPHGRFFFSPLVARRAQQSAWKHILELGSAPAPSPTAVVYGGLTLAGLFVVAVCVTTEIGEEGDNLGQMINGVCLLWFWLMEHVLLALL